MMNKKKILAFIVATVLVMSLAVLYVMFRGNPITRIIAHHKIAEYVSENYPELNYKLGNTFYNFLSESYGRHVDVEGSEDEDFIAEYEDGKVKDNRETAVVEGDNIGGRIQQLLNKEKLEEPAKSIFKEYYSQGFCTPVNVKEIWKDVPKDITIREFLAQYPFEASIYLTEDAKDKNLDTQEMKDQVIQKYKERGITVVNVEIDYLDIPKYE